MVKLQENGIKYVLQTKSLSLLDCFSFFMGFFLIEYINIFSLDTFLVKRKFIISVNKSITTLY